MTMTQLEEATLDYLDFAPVCEMSTCEHAADWWIVCQACNAHAPWCDCCLYTGALGMGAARPNERVACTRCLETVHSRRWRSLFDVVPIRSS